MGNPIAETTPTKDATSSPARKNLLRTIHKGYLNAGAATRKSKARAAQAVMSFFEVNITLNWHF